MAYRSKPAFRYLAMICQIDHRDGTENLAATRVSEISRKNERRRHKYLTLRQSRVNASYTLSLVNLLGMSSPPLLVPSYWNNANQWWRYNGCRIRWKLTAMANQWIAFRMQYFMMKTVTMLNVHRQKLVDVCWMHHNRKTIQRQCFFSFSVKACTGLAPRHASPSFKILTIAWSCSYYILVFMSFLFSWVWN